MDAQEARACLPEQDQNHQYVQEMHELAPSASRLAGFFMESVMTFTIDFGWWLLPLVVTLFAFGAASFMCRDEGSHGDYAAIGNAMVALVAYGSALIVSMAAWLLWALLA